MALVVFVRLVGVAIPTVVLAFLFDMDIGWKGAEALSFFSLICGWKMPPGQLQHAFN